MKLETLKDNVFKLANSAPVRYWLDWPDNPQIYVIYVDKCDSWMIKTIEGLSFVYLHCNTDGCYFWVNKE